LTVATPARVRPVPALRTLLVLAWPIVVSRSSQAVVGLTDALMVASLGQSALAATTTGAFNTFAAFIFPMGITFLVSSFASQLTGQGDLTGARRYGHYGLILAALTQVVSLASLPFLGPLLGWFPYAADVRGLIEQYLRIRLLSTGAAIGIEALANYYGGIGNTRLPMLASLVAMVLNILGCWLFIAGHWGAPALGVAGSAWAATGATWLAFLGLWAWFLRDGRTRDGSPAKEPRSHGLRLGEFTRMLRFGLPSGLNWFFEFFAFNLFVNLVMAGLGTTSLAAMMAVLQINSVSFMPAFALTSAGAILVGQAIGAGAKGEVPRIVRLTFGAAGAWQGLVGLLYVAVPGAIFAAFARGASNVPALHAAGVRLLMLSAAWQLFDAGANTLAEALRAAGDTTFTMWARLVIAWAIFIPGAYLSVHYLGWGDLGAVSWVLLYLGLLALVLLLRFRAGAWRKINLTGGDRAVI
jgi:MATE family multidrug resistance protein